MAFIFDPTKGETPESLRKKREIAEALKMNATGMASSPGEGLAMIGAAIGSRIADSKANKIAASGRKQASSAMAPILAALGGGAAPAVHAAPPQASARAVGDSSLPPSFLSALDKHEGGGGYDTLFGFSQKNGPFAGTDVSQMTIGQVLDFTNPSGPYANYVKGKVGRVATPTGRHQIVGTTLRNAANEMGLSPDTPYNQQTQDSIALHLAQKRVRGAKDLPSKISGLRSEWEGFKNVPDAQMAQIVSEIENGGDSPSSAAQAVSAMAQGGRGSPQPAPQMTPQAAPQQMPVQGYARQNMVDGAAEPGKTVVPAGKRSGGLGQVISSLLGRGGQQQAAPQQMAPQMQPQPVVADPSAYNAGVVRMSPDLAGPARQPAPQGQPPIPGLQPSAPTMADMGGRMPAPAAQPMAQGVGGLRTAMQPAPAAPQPAAAPQQPMAPQPAAAAPQAGANGLGLPQLLQIAQNPWVAENKLYGGIINTLIEDQLSMNKPMDPMEKAQLEKLLLETEQLRNPVAKPTGDMTEYDLYAEQAQAAGEQPMSFLDYQQALKKAGATNVTTNVGEGDKFYENLDKKNAETFSALSDTGMQARSKLAQVDRLSGLLAAAPQGASAMLKQAAGEFGINTEGLSDIQAAQALINELVPQQRQPGSGPMSDADLALFKQSLPRLINQPEGNAMILDTMRGIAEYQIKMGEIADAVANREIKPADGRKAIASLENPLAGYGKRAGQIGKDEAAQGSRQGAPAGVEPDIWEVMTPEEKALFQ